MLELSPITFSEAAAFVLKHHRHHKPPISHKFSIACAQGGEVVAVVIVGRPVSRHLDDGYTLEIVRLCSIGAPNACSKLAAAAWRVARGLGYRKLITYILDSETGVSYKAAGFKIVGKVKGRSWHRDNRPRVDKHPLQCKLRLEIGGAPQ